MATINAGNITKGTYIMYRNAPNLVTKAEFMAPGKGSPIMRVKLKNVRTGTAGESTYKTNESVEVAEVDKKEMQFLYRDGDEIVFMDPKTYAQAAIPLSLIGDQTGYLIPDLKCWVLWYENQAIGISLPPHVDLLVTDAPEAVAGNRVNAPKRLVSLETGIEVLAPLFIKTGDKITIDTASGEYLSRVVNN
jgi:elongation factor P